MPVVIVTTATLANLAEVRTPPSVQLTSDSPNEPRRRSGLES
jgi:hypothetical protein